MKKNIFIKIKASDNTGDMPEAIQTVIRDTIESQVDDIFNNFNNETLTMNPDLPVFRIKAGIPEGEKFGVDDLMAELFNAARECLAANFESFEFRVSIINQ